MESFILCVWHEERAGSHRCVSYSVLLFLTSSVLFRFIFSEMMSVRTRRISEDIVMCRRLSRTVFVEVFLLRWTIYRKSHNNSGVFLFDVVSATANLYYRSCLCMCVCVCVCVHTHMRRVVRACAQARLLHSMLICLSIKTAFITLHGNKLTPV